MKSANAELRDAIECGAAVRRAALTALDTVGCEVISIDVNLYDALGNPGPVVSARFHMPSRAAERPGQASDATYDRAIDVLKQAGIAARAHVGRLGEIRIVIEESQA